MLVLNLLRTTNKKGEKTMKKSAILMMAIFGASIIASAAHAQTELPSVQKKSLEMEINFSGSGLGNTIKIYNALTGGTEITTKQTITGLQAMADTQKNILRTYLEIKPDGLFDVAIYTNNLDKDTNEGHIDPAYIPANWANYTRLQRANFVGGYAGLPHADYPQFILPVKVWSLVSAGAITRAQYNLSLAGDAAITETIAPPISAIDPQVPDTASNTINDYDNPAAAFAWFGTSDLDKNDPNYYPGSYGYIPEKLAVDTSKYTTAQLKEKADPAYGNYTKKVAGTLYGTNINVRTEVAFGVDLRTAGKGKYSGIIYFDLRSN